MRLTEQTPYAPWNRIAIPFTLFVLFPNFFFVISSHVTGVNDLLANNGRQLPGGDGAQHHLRHGGPVRPRSEPT